VIPGDLVSAFRDGLAQAKIFNAIPKSIFYQGNKIYALSLSRNAGVLSGKNGDMEKIPPMPSGKTTKREKNPRVDFSLKG